MKKIICSVAAAVLSALLFAQDYSALLKKAEDNTAFYGTDFKGNYTIVHNKPGEGQKITEAIMYRRDSENKWTILVTGPASEKGKGYLQYDGNIWFYDPADSAFTFTSAKDKFQNTNANNSDFAPQKYFTNYAIDSAEKVKLGKLDCVLFCLSAKVDNVDYPRLKLWVTENDGLVRKKEDYSLSGKMLRTTFIPKYQSIKNGGDISKIPVNMLIADSLKGKKIAGKVEYEKTQITIVNAEFSKQKDSVYTKPYLEMMKQR